MSTTSMSTRQFLKRFYSLRAARKIASTTVTHTHTVTTTTGTTQCLCRSQPLSLPPSRQTFKHHQQVQKRYLHRAIAQPPVPKPTPFIPDPQTFLTVIGRDLSQHASKFPNWEALFSLTSQELRDLGIEPARSRRYLLRWLERFRNGRFGVGGDCTDVNEDGSAELRIVETPVTAVTAAAESVNGGGGGGDGTDDRSALQKATATRSAGMRRVVVNLSGRTVGVENNKKDDDKNVGPGKDANEVKEKEQGEGKGEGEGDRHADGKVGNQPLKKRFGLQLHLQLPAEEAERRKVTFVSLKNSTVITGPHVEPIKASDGGAVGVARIARQEGLWEDKRGRKIDGGERRKAQVRAKRRKAERKAAGIQR